MVGSIEEPFVPKIPPDWALHKVVNHKEAAQFGTAALWLRDATPADIEAGFAKLVQFVRDGCQQHERIVAVTLPMGLRLADPKTRQPTKNVTLFCDVTYRNAQGIMRRPPQQDHVVGIGWTHDLGTGEPAR